MKLTNLFQHSDVYKSKPIKEISENIVLLAGKPVDVHILSDFLPDIDQLKIKTVIRQRVFRKLEELRRFEPQKKIKFNWGMVLLILLAVGLLLLGIIIVMYWPQIQHALSGMFGGILPK